MEKEVESREEGLSEATDAFHETRVDAEGVVTDVSVERVVANDDDRRVYVCFDDGDEWLWVCIESRSYRHRMDAIGRLSPTHDANSLTGSQFDLYLDYGQGVVRKERGGDEIGEIAKGLPQLRVLDLSPHEIPGKIVGETDTDKYVVGDVSSDPEYDPDWATDLDEFDRLLAVERGLEYGPGPIPTAEVILDATGGREEVVAEAEINGGTVRWTFEMPSAEEFEGSPLRQFLDELGAGDPDGLDGHSVHVSMTGIPGVDGGVLESDCGEVAIVPREELGLGEESDEESEPETFRHIEAAVIIGLIATTVWGVGISVGRPALGTGLAVVLTGVALFAYNS